MCGKFTAMYSWREVVTLSLALLSGNLVEGQGGEGQEAGEGGNDQIDTLRVNGLLRVIVWDAETRARRVVPMRWGFPDPRDWRRPRPIHARSETIDAKEPFRTPFHAGQRGIVLFRTFNEGEEVVKPSGKPETRQWMIDSKDGRPRGFAFVWRRFEIADLPAPLLACCHGDGACQRAHPAHDQVPGGRSPRAGHLGGRRLAHVAGRSRRNTCSNQGAAEDHGRRELAGSAGAEEAENPQALSGGWVIDGAGHFQWRAGFS
ncbi:MAG: SOS response-associated peptidase family protein [Reyranella sp.]|nr:SOS response-associated peptidase family protein [Reyranella sp.]